MSDLQEWAKSVQSQAEDLQRTNKFARKLYLLAALFCLTFWIITRYPLPLAMVVFFGLLLAFNESLIWRMRKSGVR